MKIVIHRGTHQIGGISTEISTESSRVLIDMGDELSLEPSYVQAPLSIDGITNNNGFCNGVLFTHYHGDHIGQMTQILDNIPMYSGALAKKIMLKSTKRAIKVNQALCSKIEKLNTFTGGKTLYFGNISVTPYSIDHSACDSYMFLIEAEEKRVLYTGDFRLHGFRGKAIPKIINKILAEKGKIDALITEGTNLSRPESTLISEFELQQKVKEYLKQYKYVYVFCSTTYLERICALSKSVPKGKYFVCDKYQNELLDLFETHYQSYSSFYKNIKKVVYGDNIYEKLRDKGFLMTVRDNSEFRKIIKKFDKSQGIILYSLWDGYRTKTNSTIPNFLNLTDKWEYLHTSGHVSGKDLISVVDLAKPDIIIPMHTETPEKFKDIFKNFKVYVPNDKEEIIL